MLIIWTLSRSGTRSVEIDEAFRRAMIISKTPVRVSFCGGGTDLDGFAKKEHLGGLVVSTAISRYIHVTVNERFDDCIRLSYSRMETVDSIDEVQHDLVREAMRITGVTSGVEITTIADIPSRGTGLGSSSVVTVGVLNALHHLAGRTVGPRQLAEEACKIEIDILGEPIGRQDQYAAAFGGLNRISFGEMGVEVVPITTDPGVVRRMEKEFCLVYTGSTRSASTVLGEESYDAEDKLNRLRAIRGQAEEAEKLIQSGDLDALGRLLHNTWELKKGLSPSVTNDGLDSLYSKLIDLGVTGGKLLGAGGGGFFLVHGDDSIASRLMSSLPRINRVLPLVIEEKGSEIIHS